MVFTLPIDTVAEEMYTPGALEALRKDLRKSAATLSEREVRFLVDQYYTVQGYRIQCANQMRALGKADEPIALLDWMFTSIQELEKEITKWMLAYASGGATGQWALSVCGIGPVLAAGFLSNLDLEKTTNVSKFWAFAGLDPTKVWAKGQKRPWNAHLKVLAYKAGESFVKVQNNKNDTYGKLYVERKKLEATKNDGGGFKEQAATVLRTKNIGHDTDAYAAYIQGKLPPAHLHARARRHAVKIFLSHFWHVAFENKYGQVAPDPWVIALGGHTDRIPIPNHACIDPRYNAR